MRGAARWGMGLVGGAGGWLAARGAHWQHMGQVGGLAAHGASRWRMGLVGGAQVWLVARRAAWSAVLKAGWRHMGLVGGAWPGLAGGT